MHFTVHSLDLVVFICVYFVFFSYCIYVVLLSTQWSGPNRIEAWSLRLLFFQCFDTTASLFVGRDNDNKSDFTRSAASVSYTHLTLPTILRV